MMKVAIISDTHLGDPMCTLFTEDGRLGPKYEELIEATGKGNNYLILLGDNFDYSIRARNEVIEDFAKPFFKQLNADGVADKYIFVAGNHDYDMQDMIRIQADFINPLVEKRKLKDYRFSVPGILDFRVKDPVEAFTLPTVTRKPGNDPYGFLFLDYIIKDGTEEGKSYFYIAYPNLYLITPDSKTFLLTHGQYFETYWALASEWAPLVFGTKLGLGQPLDLDDLVALNHPLSQLACSGTGQAGPLTDIIRVLQKQAKMRDEKGLIEEYLDNLGNEIDKRGRYGIKVWKEAIENAAISGGKRTILNAIKNRGVKTIIDYTDKMFPEDTIERMTHYFKSTQLEVKDLNEYKRTEIPFDNVSLLFGHTHNPIGILKNKKQPSLKIISASTQLKVPYYNTGGWLLKPPAYSDVYGGGVFTFDSKKGLEYKKVDVTSR
jgi:predicted phosphodiesterase